MKLNCKEFKVKEYLTVVPFGDMHYGSKECDEKLIYEWIDWIKKQKNIAVIGMGDFINCGTKVSVGAGSYDDRKIPEEQYNDMIDMLKPIKDKIIGMHIGNHEERIRQLSSFDIVKEMSKRLDVQYLGYSALNKLKVNKFNYIAFSTHGSSGSTTNAGRIAACQKLQDIANADLYLMGHTHGLMNFATSYLDVNLKNKIIEEHKKHFVLTGNFVSWTGGYGEQKNYPLLKKGAPKIKLFGDRFDTHVSL